MNIFLEFQKRIIGIFTSILLVLTSFSLFGTTTEDTFTSIYNNGRWGKNKSGEGTSGSGSSLATTEGYRAFLQHFFTELNIHSVVDVGCGDWEFSQTINWDGIDYTGFDVVKFVIEKNKMKFSKQNIRFIHSDVLQTKLPKADLLICKDVLQHLTNKDILSFIPQLSNFKYCLITNDVHPQSLTSNNPTIPRGGYRPIDLTQPPFNLAGYKILTYVAAEVTKQVLLIVNVE